MELRTLDGFEAHLTEDLKWREHELTTWEQLVAQARKHEKYGLLRGGGALLYAHWEGYVKEACRAYIEYVSRKGLKVNQLSSPFVAISLRTIFGVGEASKNARDHIMVVEMARNAATATDSVYLPYDRAMVRTNANLSFDRYLDIMASVGCNGALHEIHRIQITRLLRARNDIAHGQHEEIELDDWRQMYRSVKVILRDLRTQLQNAASTEAYKMSL